MLEPFRHKSNQDDNLHFSFYTVLQTTQEAIDIRDPTSELGVCTLDTFTSGTTHQSEQADRPKRISVKARMCNTRQIMFAKTSQHGRMTRRKLESAT